LEIAADRLQLKKRSPDIQTSNRMIYLSLNDESLRLSYIIN
jgi:hypothetical protein